MNTATFMGAPPGLTISNDSSPAGREYSESESGQLKTWG